MRVCSSLLSQFTPPVCEDLCAELQVARCTQLGAVRSHFGLSDHFGVDAKPSCTCIPPLDCDAFAADVHVDCPTVRLMIPSNICLNMSEPKLSEQEEDGKKSRVANSKRFQPCACRSVSLLTASASSPITAAQCCATQLLAAPGAPGLPATATVTSSIYHSSQRNLTVAATHIPHFLIRCAPTPHDCLACSYAVAFACAAISTCFAVL